MKTKRRLRMKGVLRAAVLFIVLGLIFGTFLYFVNDYYDHYNKRNLNLCKTLEGKPFTYALDQKEWLCQIPNKTILDLNEGTIFNITKLNHRR